MAGARILSMTTQKTVKKTVRKVKPTVCYAFKCHYNLSQKNTKQGARFCPAHWRMIPSFLREEMGLNYRIYPDLFEVACYKAMMAICMDEEMPLVEWDIPQEAYDAWYTDSECRVYDRISMKVELKNGAKNI